MADYVQSELLSRFILTLREAQFARPDERGRWVRATCRSCSAEISIGGETANAFLHSLDEHRCEVTQR